MTTRGWSSCRVRSGPGWSPGSGRSRLLSPHCGSGLTDGSGAIFAVRLTNQPGLLPAGSRSSTRRENSPDRLAHGPGRCLPGGLFGLTLAPSRRTRPAPRCPRAQRGPLNRSPGRYCHAGCSGILARRACRAGALLFGGDDRRVFGLSGGWAAFTQAGQIRGVTGVTVAAQRRASTSGLGGRAQRRRANGQAWVKPGQAASRAVAGQAGSPALPGGQARRPGWGGLVQHRPIMA